MLPFEEHFHKYKERIFYVIYRVTNNYQEAEDLTLEVFLRGYRKYKNFREETDFYVYLYRIAINLCCDYIRRAQRQRRRIGTIFSLDRPVFESEKKIRLDPPDKQNPHPDEQLEKKELAQLVRKAISKLPAKYARTIILRDLENFSYEEISKILKISQSEVGVRLFRARRRLRKFLNKKGDGFIF